MTSGETLESARNSAGVTREFLGVRFGKNKDWIKDRETGRLSFAQADLDALVALCSTIAQERADDLAFATPAQVQAMREKHNATLLQLAQSAGFTTSDWACLAIKVEKKVSTRKLKSMETFLSALSAAGLTGRKGERKADKVAQATLSGLRRRYGMSGWQMDTFTGHAPGHWTAAEQCVGSISRECINGILKKLKEGKAEKKQNLEDRGGIYYVAFRLSDGRRMVKLGCAGSGCNLRHRQSRAISRVKTNFDADAVRVGGCGYALPLGVCHRAAEKAMLAFARQIEGEAQCTKGGDNWTSEHFIDTTGQLVERVFEQLMFEGWTQGAIPVIAQKVRVAISAEDAALVI